MPRATPGSPRSAPRGSRRPLSGLLDAFSYPLPASRYLSLLAPRRKAGFLTGTLEAACSEAPGVRTLRIRPFRSWPGHRPGQHVRLGVPIGGRFHSRCYSISSAPGAPGDAFTLTVKADPDGLVSRHLVNEARPGDRFQLGPPEGEFLLPEAPAPLLFLTGGSGITPVMSMLRHLAAQEGLTDVVHLHYARTAGDVIFREALEALERDHPGYRLQRRHTRPPGGPQRGKLRLAPAVLRALGPDWAHREAYACGPAGLLASAEALWREAGAASRLHLERFQAPLALPADGALGGRVRFAKSRVDALSDGRRSLLSVAESAGMSPAHGCRMGICHSCTVTLRCGRVRDLRNDTILDEPGARVQLCVCAAAGDVELEA